MKIAALVTEAFGGHGGIAQYNRDLLTALASRPDVSSVDVLPRLVRDQEAATGEMDHPSIDFHAGGAESVPSYLAALARMLTTKPRYDAVVCGHINLLPAAELVRRRHKAPLAMFIYGIDAWRPASRRIAHHLIRKVDAVVSISDFTRRRFLDWNPLPEDKTFILPNALHSERYGVSAKPAYLLERYGLHDCSVLLTVGRLSSTERYKGVDELISLMPRLLKRNPRIRYVVAGDGDDRERLVEHARRTGVDTQVIFTGGIREKEKGDHYRLADAYVMVGRGEGFGFVYLEAMACGVPVVASVCDGSREAVRNGEIGLLASPDDEDDLENKVIAALERPRGIPDGLDYFFYPRFQERLDTILARTLGWESAAA